MNKIKSTLFSKETGIRHLIMLAITPVIILWIYASIALITKDWHWIQIDRMDVAPSVKMQFLGWIGTFLTVVSLVATGTYWNAKKWMLQYLSRALLALPKAITEIGEAIHDYTHDPDEHVVYDETNDIVYTESSALPYVFAIPLSIILCCIRGIFYTIINLIAAVGIPVLSPITFILALWGVVETFSTNTTIMFIFGIVVILGFLFAFIVQPIISFIVNSEPKQTNISE